MATVNQIIEEAKKLPAEERRRLRIALESLDPSGEVAPPPTSHDQERAWIHAHRKEYLGQWVAVDRDRLVAHGVDARSVYLAAREAGIPSPRVDGVESQEEPFTGGWLGRRRRAPKVRHTSPPAVP